jgi:hypothetical protein
MYILVYRRVLKFSSVHPSNDTIVLCTCPVISVLFFNLCEIPTVLELYNFIHLSLTLLWAHLEF